MKTERRVGFGILIYGSFLALLGVGELVLILPIMLLGLDGAGTQAVPLIVARVLHAWPLLARKAGQIAAGVILSVIGAGLVGGRSWAKPSLKKFLWAALFIVPTIGGARIAQSTGSLSGQAAVFMTANLLLNVGGIAALLIWLHRDHGKVTRG